MEQPDERGNRTLNRYVTGRVLKAFRRSRISNLRIEKLSDLEVSASVYEIGSRYRLPRDYDAVWTHCTRESGPPTFPCDEAAAQPAAAAVERRERVAS